MYHAFYADQAHSINAHIELSIIDWRKEHDEVISERRVLERRLTAHIEMRPLFDGNFLRLVYTFLFQK